MNQSRDILAAQLFQAVAGVLSRSGYSEVETALVAAEMVERGIKVLEHRDAPVSQPMNARRPKVQDLSGDIRRRILNALHRIPGAELHIVRTQLIPPTDRDYVIRTESNARTDFIGIMNGIVQLSGMKGALRFLEHVRGCAVNEELAQEFQAIIDEVSEPG